MNVCVCHTCLRCGLAPMCNEVLENEAIRQEKQGWGTVGGSQQRELLSRQGRVRAFLSSCAPLMRLYHVTVCHQ